MTALSLHIGLNHVDPAAYGGWDGQLSGCLNDCNDMEAYARSKGFVTHSLQDRDALSGHVIESIELAITELQSGDIFMLTYSGHGGQVPDPREEDGQSETWVLYDRQFVDDEIFELLANFRPGVRVVVFSDSCHSGTVIRGFVPDSTEHRAMPVAVCRGDVAARGEMYAEILRGIRPVPQHDAQATAFLISGCQDNQTSADGDRNGLFTEKLRQVLAEGDAGQRFGYRALRDRVVALMPPDQSPNFYSVGPRNTVFEDSQPVTP